MSAHEKLPRDPGPMVSSHSVTITFNEHQSGLIHYLIQMDPVARESRSLSPMQLSQRGESLALLGVRALDWLVKELKLIGNSCRTGCLPQGTLTGRGDR